MELHVRAAGHLLGVERRGGGAEVEGGEAGRVAEQPRLADVAERAEASVVRVESPWGEPADVDALVREHRAHPEAKFVAVIHAETSTGAATPLDELGAYLAKTDTLFLVDAVTSLGGMRVDVDEWHVDLCYSGTQKCLSVPPGLSPITVSQKALDVMDRRQHKVQSWYLDLSMIRRYWGDDRTYHHTAPTSMIAGLHAGLRVVLDEGLEARWQRHAELGAAFMCAEFGFDGDVRNAGYIGPWVELLKSDKRAFFTACSRASKAADYLRGLALAEPSERAA